MKDLVQRPTQGKHAVNFSYCCQDRHLCHYLLPPHPLATTTTPTTITSAQETYRLFEEAAQDSVRYNSSC